VSDSASQVWEACKIDAPKVSDNEAQDLMQDIDGWDLLEEETKKLRKVYSFSSYQDSKDFVNKVAEMAEAEDHHPKIILEWGKVTILWWSHKIKGLHKNDFICASKTDLIYVR